MKTLDEILAGVPWDQLEGSEGPAGDVPDMVRQLCSPDPAARDEARDILADNLNHQGSAYEPDAYLIAQLLFLLRSPGFAGREEALDLLYRFGRGTGIFTAHQKLTTVRDMYTPEKLAAMIAEEAVWLKRLHAELLMGVELFWDLLGDPNPAIRQSAVKILTLLPERKAESLTKLQALFSSEPLPDVRDTALRAAEYLQAS
jgi:hypothetical protein